MTHEEIAALLERLELHGSWRDSHGELNAAPNDAATAIRQLMVGNERMRDVLKMANTAINAAFAQAEAEFRYHDKAASRHDIVVRTFREKVRAALGEQP